MQVIFLHDKEQTQTAMRLMGKVNKQYPKASCVAMPLNVPQAADVCAWLQVAQVPQIVIRVSDAVRTVLPMTEEVDFGLTLGGATA